MTEKSNIKKSKLLSRLAVTIIPVVIVTLIASFVMCILYNDVPRTSFLTIILALVSTILSFVGVILAIISAVTAPDSDKENK